MGSLAGFNFRRGNVAEAVVLNGRVLELDPLDPEVPASIWVGYLHLGDEERAEAWVAETIRLDPEAEVSALGPAVLAYDRGEDADAYAIAREELAQPLNNRFGSVSVYRIMVRDIALARGDVAEAEAVMEELVGRRHRSGIRDRSRAEFALYPCQRPARNRCQGRSGISGADCR